MAIELTAEQEAWLRELETTTKKRGDRFLHDAIRDRYCCLGVYCQMKVDEGLYYADAVSTPSRVIYGIDEYKCVKRHPTYRNRAVLFTDAVERLGLNSTDGAATVAKDGSYPVFVERDGTHLYVSSIVMLNDNLPLDEYPMFKEIAAFIRQHKERFFVQFQGVTP